MQEQDSIKRKRLYEKLDFIRKEVHIDALFNDVDALLLKPYVIRNGFHLQDWEILPH